MRVIAGEAKGKKLLSVPGIRPITDRVKEALFDILGERVVDALFLDLFAGTGSVGIEALSRGARWAVFVERSRKAVEIIGRNLRLTGLADRAQVVHDDVFKFLKKGPGQSFDLVYIAPPQYKGLWARTLLALDGRGFLAEKGLAIAQIFPKEYKDLELRSLRLVDKRRYGSTMLCFYINERPAANPPSDSRAQSFH